ncbi:MAG: hypothetical protein FJY85_10460 [Deltaproteobacteria bacterium]|nr:hypothetical protein [Deltaproteobacteria bacterium]
MKKPVTIFSMTFLVLMAFTVLPAVALEPPVITLERVDVASIQPFFVKPRIGYKDEKDPGKEMTYGYSSTLNVAYIFDIKNPNKEALMLDELQFTANFEGFDVNTVLMYEDSWIPGGKTDQVRVIVSNEAFPMIVSLSVGAEFAEKIKEMNTNPGALVKKWFDTISDFSFPISVTNGTALFKDEKGKEIQSTFSATWHKKEEKKEEAPEKK